MATILYFAALRDLTSCVEEVRELPAEVRTVREFMAYIQRARPELAGRMASVRVALDETFADAGDSLDGVRVIALIPPVSGG
ncbi:MAG TPA: molybdopterin converting factor subunit 1 [Polyangiaceae bacterium]